MRCGRLVGAAVGVCAIRNGVSVLLYRSTRRVADRRNFRAVASVFDGSVQ